MQRLRGMHRRDSKCGQYGRGQQGGPWPDHEARGQVDRAEIPGRAGTLRAVPYGVPAEDGASAVTLRTVRMIFG